MRALTDAQKQILVDLDNPKRYGDGWATAVWIAESCGHFYETIWASSKLPGLIKRGLVERGTPGYYRITEAGRKALAEARAAGIDVVEVR